MNSAENQYEKGLVSVVIPTYRRNNQLAAAVQSVLDQTYPKVEVLIVDDNVPGDSYSVALECLKDTFRDDRVRLVRQEKHINGAAARNAGILAARGEFIAFLDDDDWWEKVKIDHQLKYLRAYGKEWGGVSCLVRTYRNGKLVKVNTPYKEGYWAKDIICRRIGIGTGSPVLRRECLDQSGYFDPKLTRMQDLQLFTEFCSRFRMGLLKEYLYNRNIDDKSNQPPITGLKEIKKQFFASIDDVMGTFSESDRKTIEIMTSFDMAYNYWNAGLKKDAFMHAIQVFRKPITAIYAAERIVKRIREVKLREYYDKRYSKSTL